MATQNPHEPFFAISVSIVSNSIEEELKTELELSRFAMSLAGPISDNRPAVVRPRMMW